MRYLKWTLILVFWAFVAAFLHYTLPQTDIVRITRTYESEQSFGENSLFWAHADTGAGADQNKRFVFFIASIQPNGKPMVYRNEDTGWGWPPYFKFDTSNLQTEAADLIATAANPRWAAVKHYGWRNEFMTIYPNAVSVREVASPDVRIIPWLNIIILTVLAAIYWAIRVRWLRFRRARIDPTMEEIGDSFADAGDAISERRGRFRRWWRRTTGG